MIRSFWYFKRKFKTSNVCVCGLIGRGKDLLFGNIIVRRNKPYISNVVYDDKKNYMPINFDLLDLGGVTYDDFINGTVPYYEFPYLLGSDVYISDVGVYFPAQYCNDLNKKYPYLATYMALSRQVSRNHVHVNVQNLNRAFDKIREMSDIYLWCDKCFYINIPFIKRGFVIQKIIEYDKYDSAVLRVKPCRVSVPLFNKEASVQAKIYRDQFYNSHGSVKKHWTFYINKSKHDTFLFSDMFKRGVKKYVGSKK